MSSIQQRIDELGVNLPQVAAPEGTYIPALAFGDVVYTSGQLPFVDGKLTVTGRVGAEVSIEQAQDAARASALNGLAAIKQQLGSLDRITRVLKLTVFVNSATDFYDQAKVANGASDFIGQVFGDRGRHVRSAVGVAALPLNSPVEIEFTVAYE